MSFKIYCTHTTVKKYCIIILLLLPLLWQRPINVHVLGTEGACSCPGQGGQRRPCSANLLRKRFQLLALATAAMVVWQFWGLSPVMVFSLVLRACSFLSTFLLQSILASLFLLTPLPPPLAAAPACAFPAHIYPTEVTVDPRLAQKTADCPRRDDPVPAPRQTGRAAVHPPVHSSAATSSSLSVLSRSCTEHSHSRP